MNVNLTGWRALLPWVAVALVILGEGMADVLAQLVEAVIWAY